MILLYIDPGTGAMLFTTILGLVATLSFAIRKLFFKLKFSISSANAGSMQDDEKKEFVIFADDKRYWNIFKPICDEFEKRKAECHYLTASEDDPALSEKYEYVKCSFIGKGNKAYARMNMLNAGICLSTTPGLEVYQWKRSRNTDYYVHIMHEVGGLALYKMFGMDFYDAVLLTGSALEPELRELEQLRSLPPKEVAVVGSTYMDELLKKHKEFNNQSEETLGNKPRVLIAPSWGEMGLLKRFGRELLLPLYESDYDITIRPHPQSYISEKQLLTQLTEEFPEKGNWHWNRDNDNFAALENSDILISDFSGIIFDYALVFEKPVIFSYYDFDFSRYDACWIDHPTFRDEVQPKLGLSITKEDVPNICGLIDDVLSGSGTKAALESAKNLCWENIGHSAETVVDWLISKQGELRKVGDK